MEKAFWVEWRGYVRDDQGRVERDDLQIFLAELIAKLTSHPSICHPATISRGDNVYLSSSVNAESDGAAVDKVQQAFCECIAAVGAESDLGHASQPSWQVHELESSFAFEKQTLEVRELVDQSN